jgi:hypothetical protein
VVAHLHGIPGNAHQGAARAELRIVFVGCIPQSAIRLLVSRAIAISDGDEGRHA